MSQKPHLDDFFRAARSEEPVISHEEVRQLIHARHTQSTTQHISWKGIGMTTIGLGFLAVLSYFTLFGSTTELPVERGKAQEARGKQLDVQAFRGSVVQPDEQSVQTIGRSENLLSGASLAPRPSSLLSAVSTPTVEAPIKIDELKITEPGEGDMKRLGMKVDGGREVVVVQKVGRKFYVVTFGAKPFKIAATLEDENTTDIDPSDILPVFVTNLDGTGILTATAPNENTSIMTKEVHTSTIDGNAVDKTIERTATNVNVRHESDVDVDVEADINIDMSNGKSEFDYNYKYDIDSVIRAAFAGAGEGAEARAKIIVKNGDKDVTIDASSLEGMDAHPKALHKEVRIAVNNGEESHAINIHGLDSNRQKIVVAHLIADSLKGMEFDMRELHNHLENMQSDLHNEINDSASNAKIHNLLKEMRNSMKQLHIRHKSDPSDFKVKAKTFIVPGFGELRGRVNELVPVRVSLSEEFGKGLVFWYEPSAMPAKSEQKPQSVASKGSFENITINPNPARGHAILRFTMKDEHAVTITVHDILGKRLIEAGQITPVSAGEITRELDLSSLSEGVYLVVLTTDSGEQRIERILVKK